MKSHSAALRRALTAVVLLGCAQSAHSTGACDAFTWDVHHERALFATQAVDQKAGSVLASAPVVALDTLYRLSLTPQKQVAFVFSPGKKSRVDNAYAGLLRLRIAAGGLYRVALSGRLWIDVAQDGRVVASADFTGARGCSAPHKIVLYRLTAGEVLLQVSGGTSPQAELTVTRAPGH